MATRVVSARLRKVFRVPEKTFENISDSEHELICSYLENPTQHGIWVLEMDWLNNKGITKDIDLSISSIYKEQKRPVPSFYRDAFHSYWSIMKLFIKLSQTGKRASVVNQTYFESILEKVDLKDIKVKYKQEIGYFKKTLYLRGVDDRGQGLKRIKSGLYCLIFNEEKSSERQKVLTKRKIRLVSFNKHVLEDLLQFLVGIGKVENPDLKRIFSPASDVFSPYVILLGVGYKTVKTSVTNKERFARAIQEYENEEYPYCIGTVGIITEDILKEIYETFFREVYPKAASLGDVYQALHDNLVILKNEKNPIDLLDQRDIFNKLKTLELGKSRSLSKIHQIEIMRELLKHSIGVKHAVDTIKQRDIVQSVFPLDIRRDIQELRTYRNSVSHASPVPLSSYEALRSLYACFRLMSWWTKEKNATDWGMDKKEILQLFVQRSKELYFKDLD